MSQIQPLCAICQASISSGMFCAECAANYADYIEAEPLPSWISEAQQTERNRRNGDRRQDNHADDPTVGELASRIRQAWGTDASYRLYTEEHKPFDDKAARDLPRGTSTDFYSEIDVLNQLTPDERSQLTDAERMAVIVNATATYQHLHGNEYGDVKVQPSYDLKVFAFNSTALDVGIINRPIGTSRYRKILKSAQAKLKKFRPRISRT